MRATPIARPLADEHVIAVWPPLGADARDHWNRRLHLFAGRSLSDAALTSEQAGRAGRLATYGQSRAAGIAHGLEITLEREGDERPRYYYRISPGQGLTVSGEDVSVPRELRINVLDVPVCAPPYMFELLLDDEERPPLSSQLLPREIGVSLGKLIEDRDGVDPTLLPELPRVGVLVLQPITVELVGNADPQDTCERDPANDAFEDWQTIDGSRLLWYAWPTEWHRLPRLDWRRRNQIAYDIFTAEQTLDRDDLMPWEQFGVPLGVVAFNRQWKPLYFDRHAVVREGGGWRERTTVIRGPNRMLGRARFKQFVEQLADTASDDPVQVARELRWLPPVGILPSNFIEPRRAIDHFFPSSWRTEAIPIPLEELEASLQPSAELAPFDLFTRDEVEVIVPVPGAWYEPGLLVREVVDPIFQATIDRFVIKRGRWLRRRIDLREKMDAIEIALTHTPTVYPSPDPDASDETEFVATTGVDANDAEMREPEQAYGTERLSTGALAVTELESLRTQLATNTPLRSNIAKAYFPPQRPFPAPVDALPTALRSRLSRDAAGRPFILFQDEMTEADKIALTRAGVADAMFVAAVETLSKRSHQNEVIELDRRGLKGFIDWLQHRVDEADDRVDFAFARVHTDIYRIRQHMLGNEAATKLATSPALALIAQGESARATQADLQTFVKNLKSQATAQAAPVAAAPAAVSTDTVVAAESIAVGTIGLKSFATSSSMLKTLTLATGDKFSTPSALTTSLTSRFSTAGGVGAALAGASIDGTLSGGVTAQTLRATADSARVLAPLPTRGETEAITAQSPIIGKALNFRTVSLAERLQQPVAPESKDFGVSNKADLLSVLTELEINIDDIELPGFYKYKADGTIDADVVTVPNTTRTIVRPKEKRFSVLEIVGRDLVTEVLQSKHDLDPTDGDEGAFFAAGVRSLDNVVAVLRLVEGRVQAYRNVIDLCRSVLNKITALRNGLSQRLFVVGAGLAEARQDVAVARALLDEERRRVGAVNKRRDEVVRDHVPFLAFRRPRTSDLVVEAPAHRIDPGITEAPLPACLAEDVELPAGLTQMMSHIGDAPVSWFRFVHPLIDRINQPHLLVQSLQYAKVRATAHHDALLAIRATDDNLQLQHDSVRRVLSARQEVATRARAFTAALDVGALAALSWAHVRQQALDTLSIGDLADNAHGRVDVSRASAVELDHIGHVGGCLYRRFGEVLPAIRLGWAEILGQYDDAVSLRNLSILPHWGDIELLDRREIQGLVDWLYTRVEPANNDAVALISDFVRLCILLASHAPVDRIVAARIEQPTTVQPGALLHVAVDTISARIGMHVVVYAPPAGGGGTRDVVARGVVEDLGGGRAAARIVETVAAAVNLATTSVVHLVSQGSPIAAFTPKPAAEPAAGTDARATYRVAGIRL